MGATAPRGRPFSEQLWKSQLPLSNTLPVGRGGRIRGLGSGESRGKCRGQEPPLRAEPRPWATSSGSGASSGFPGGNQGAPLSGTRGAASAGMRKSASRHTALTQDGAGVRGTSRPPQAGPAPAAPPSGAHVAREGALELGSTQGLLHTQPRCSGPALRSSSDDFPACFASAFHVLYYLASNDEIQQENGNTDGAGAGD